MAKNVIHEMRNPRNVKIWALIELHILIILVFSNFDLIEYIIIYGQNILYMSQNSKFSF